jgi:hypothetical protein
MNLVSIAGAFLLAGPVSQVADPARAFTAYLQASPTLNTADNAEASVSLRCSIKAVRAIRIDVEAEYFREKYKLVIYDGRDRVPLVIVNDNDLVEFDVLNQRFVSGRNALCSFLLERRVEGNQGRVNFYAGFADVDPRQESRFLLNFASLFYDPARWEFSNANDGALRVKQTTGDGSVIEAVIDFSNKCIFRRLDLRPGNVESVLTVSNIEVGYKREKLPLPDLALAVRGLEGKGDVVLRKASTMGVMDVLSSGELILRSCLARLATRITPEDGRDDIMTALSLTQAGVERIAEFDRTNAPRMKAIVSITSANKTAPGKPEGSRR